MTYIYQLSEWPRFKWDDKLIQPYLNQVHNLQGWLNGSAASIGFNEAQKVSLTNMTEDVVNTSAIEGEILPVNQVRSSLARKLGIKIAGLVRATKSVDGIVNVLLDATVRYGQPLSKQRLYKWHKELFPNARSGLHKITVGKWRNDKNGPMQVVSGAIGMERVHFQAPNAKCLEHEMEIFIDWFNQETNLDPILKAAIAGFWFVTLHPFEDGNGRIARALTDMLLARSEKKSQRFYSVSAAIKEHRSSYYNILEKTQKGSVDITKWLLWFLDLLAAALSKSKKTFERTIKKVEFFHSIRAVVLNERQLKALNLLFENFEGALTSTKWSKLNKCSQDTAYRDILDLIEKGILEKSASQGRNTHYQLRC